MPRTARLTRDDWAAAALQALIEGGLAAVAVEPVAARLGASKSSFYWLFDNREALLTAALERWEQQHTEAVVRLLAAIDDPAARLRTLLQNAFATTGGSTLSLLLITESAHPVVRAVAERVTKRRIAVIEATFSELGHPPTQAHHVAAVAYSIYLGTAALHQVNAAPQDVPAYLDTVMTTFGLPEPKG